MSEYPKTQINDYKDLIVWQKSFELVKIIYQITSALPKSEQFGLNSQMQRAAISIPSNIAEGCNRNHTNEYVQFLGIATGSAAELETQLLLCRELYPNSVTTGALAILTEIQKMLRVLVKSLKTKS
jgi:four helix bundle protein